MQFINNVDEKYVQDSKKYIVMGGNTDLILTGIFRILVNSGIVKYVVSDKSIDIRYTEKFGIETVLNISEILNIEEYMICITCVQREYKNISDSLEQLGLSEFDNYIYYDLLYKKVAVFNMNCYQVPLKEYLLHSKKFCSEYGIYPLGETHTLKKGISESVLKHTDLFIHQDIQASNEISYFISTEYVEKILPLYCKRICVPNLVGFGEIMFPYEDGNTVKVAGKTFFVKDKVLSELIEKSDYIDEVIRAYDMYETINEPELVNKEKIEHFLEREKGWDIKIIQYILDNYKDRKLIIDRSHVSKEVMLKICKGLATYLGLDDIDEGVVVDYDLGWESIIQKSYMGAMSVEFEEHIVREFSKSSQCTYGKGLTRREYIKEYAFLVHGKILL